LITNGSLETHTITGAAVFSYKKQIVWGCIRRIPSSLKNKVLLRKQNKKASDRQSAFSLALFYTLYGSYPIRFVVVAVLCAAPLQTALCVFRSFVLCMTLIRILFSYILDTAG
jgi:hypothetical protein